MLGIPFYVWDVAERFRQDVIEDFISEYAAGRTPNPCVRCNEHIKYRALIEKLPTFDAQYVATGHYARVTRDETSGRYHLLRGIDDAKDQSYVLFGVPPDELDRMILGDEDAAASGRFMVTGNPKDIGKFKTPSLRNVALTAPYMHDGSLADLPAVLDFYDQGGVANENLSPMIKPLHLTAAEKQDLLDFLRALTGSNIETLVGDAFAAPVADWQ